MKEFKIMLIWSLLAIFIVSLGFLFLDQFVFKNSSDFNIKEVSTNNESKDYDTKLPDNAENIQCSYNGQYISYDVDSKFYIYDASANKSKEYITTDSEKAILNYKWLPDRNMIVMAEKKKNDNGKSVISLVNFNAKTGDEKSIIDLTSYSSGLEVDDIATTTLAGVSYVSISSKDSDYATLYRIDINNEMKKVKTAVKSIGQMQVCPQKDNLIYCDSSKKIYYSYTNAKNNKIKLSGNGGYDLLDIDNNSNVYLGTISGDKVSKIIYGQSDKATSTWTSVKLDKEVAPSDIHINSNNEIMVNDSDEKKVNDLTTKKSYSYSGELIQITDYVIFSKNGNKVSVKKMA